MLQQWGAVTWSQLPQGMNPRSLQQAQRKPMAYEADTLTEVFVLPPLLLSCQATHSGRLTTAPTPCKRLQVAHTTIVEESLRETFYLCLRPALNPRTLGQGVSLLIAQVQLSSG